jgi:eukaryotic-like serine/threonine-protein kinase
VLIAALVDSSAMAARRQAGTVPGADRLTIAAPEGTFFFGLTPQFAIAPNGRDVVFVANRRGEAPALWLRSVSSATARAVSGTEQASYPFWSSDGQFVGFFASGKLKKVAVSGAAPVIICDAPNGRGGTWNNADLIVFASGITDPLRQVAAAGGTPTPASVLDVPRENSHRWPQFLPDGRRILYWAGGGTAPAELRIGSLDSRETVPVGPADTNGAYAQGYVFFRSGGPLVAQRLDATTFKKIGDPLPIDGPLSADVGSSFASLSVSATGSVAYTRGTARPLLLTWFDRTGKTLGTVGEPGQYTNATVSPDGTRIAVSLTAGSPANRDIWIVDAAGGGASRLTTDPAVDASPIWSADGTDIVFSSPRGGPYQIFRNAASGTQKEELLLKADAASIATDQSADGRFIAFTRAGTTTGMDLWVLPLSGDRTPTPFLQTAAVDDNAVFSPDGRWLAYQSSESGRDEVYVRPFPASGAAARISRNGGTQPRWKGDGTELFFLGPDGAVMASGVTSTSPFTTADPSALLPAAMTLVIRHAYTVTKDGQRFLMPVLDQRNPSVITVVENWTARGAK